MNEIVCEAVWAAVYPTTGNVQEITRWLRGRLMCNWSWDLFMWDLRELRRLLMKCPAEYNYLYVTRFLVARASYLALNGPFEFHAADMVTRLAEQHVQYAGIYRYLFLRELERAKFVRHPATDDRQDERFFQLAITNMEETFRQLLQVIVCVDDPHEVILEHSVREWIAGQLREKDGTVIDMLPSAVPVHVQSEELRSYRKIKPAKAELIRKIIKKETTYTIRERHGRETACDIELERLCSWNAVKGYPIVQYGDDSFQYFSATVNELRSTIYIVCADRTLRLVYEGSHMPGTVLREIHASCVGDNPSVYEVSFDNGSRGTCKLSFRPHKEYERRQVPPSVTRQVNRRGLDITEREGAKAVNEEEATIPRRTSRSTEAKKEKSIVRHRPLRNGGYDTGKVVQSKVAKPVERKMTVAKMEPERRKKRVVNTPKPVVTIHRDFNVIEVGDQRIDFSKKAKRRAFVRFVFEEKKRSGVAEFYFEEMRDKFSQRTGKLLKSDRLEEDLFKGQPREFRLLFEEIDRASGLYRLLI